MIYQGVSYFLSYDLDRLPNLNSCDDAKQYNDDMDNISYSIPNSKLQNTKSTNLEANTPKIL